MKYEQCTHTMTPSTQGIEVPTCVDPSREDPGPGGDRSFDQTLAHHLLDARVQLEVLDPSVDRDEDFGKFHLPFLQHQAQDALRPRVVGQTHILQCATWVCFRRLLLSSNSDIKKIYTCIYLFKKKINNSKLADFVYQYGL